MKCAITHRTLSIMGRKDPESVEGMMAREIMRWRALGDFDKVKADLNRWKKHAARYESALTNEKIAAMNGKGPCQRCVGRIVVGPDDSPLPCGVPHAEIMREIEADQEQAEHLRNAVRALSRRRMWERVAFWGTAIGSLIVTVAGVWRVLDGEPLHVGFLVWPALTTLWCYRACIGWKLKVS